MIGNKRGPWKIEFPDGDTYEGDVVRGKAHGQGKFTHADGSVYDGQFKDDKYHGHGKIIANGCIYEGQWKEGREHGKGISIYAQRQDDENEGEADVYDGEFKNGMRDGVGTYKYSNGRTYEGQWKEGVYHGQGTETYSDGRIYNGQWSNDKKHGQGTMIYADGDVYEGSWSHNVMLEGKYTFATGQIYQGQFEGGYFNGNGICWYTNGDVYEGQWKDDCRHGRGVLTYANGDIYDGDWIVNKRHGHGILTTQPQKNNDNTQHDVVERCTVYEGDWSNDKKQGMGTLKEPNGDMHEQVYYKGELVAIANGSNGFRYCYDDFKISCIDEGDGDSTVNENEEEGVDNNNNISINRSTDKLHHSALATCGCDQGYCHHCILKQQHETIQNEGRLPKRIAFLIELLERRFPTNEEQEYGTFEWLSRGKYPCSRSGASTPTADAIRQFEAEDSDHYCLKKKVGKRVEGIVIEGCNIPEINGKYAVDDCSVSTTASTYDTTAASSSAV